MSFAPSVGDILMLSQLAWKIGRAFTTGKKSSPAEFAEVERESNGLSVALKLVAETLHEDTSVLSHADKNTQLAVSTILASASTTLSDLESFVDQYRVIKQKRTDGGFIVERSWSEAVIANYKKVKWTTEGGDITELRNMLHMHTNTINLTMQALQSKSMARIERTVIPMAENVAAIHDRVNGDLGDKIDDLHRFIMTIAAGTPSLAAMDREIEPKRSSADSETTVLRSINSTPSYPGKRLALPYRTPSMTDRSVSPEYSPQKTRSGREDSAYWSMIPKSYELDRGFESGSPPVDRYGIGDSVPPSGTTLAASPYEYAEPGKPRKHSARRESETLPNFLPNMDDPDATTGSAVEATSSSSHDKDDGFANRLPPPALSPVDQEPQTPATPASIFSLKPKRTNTSHSERVEPISRTVSAKEAPATPVVSAAAQNFEKLLLRNAAILCDVRGTLVEYAQHNPDEPDTRYNTEMIPACKDARIYVVRKREHKPQGGSKVTTSIWVISDDGTVRCQQTLSDTLETVPYCSYFQPEKVSLPPTEGTIMRLRFHRETWGRDCEKEITTNWVNYLLESEQAANSFQSAVFGRALLGSFRTLKTAVLHEGIKGAFAFEEKFANIEVLRLWQDDGTAQDGAGGGVLALLHLGSDFGEGWARWWMNSSTQAVRIKDEQTKFVRLKGIDLRVVKPGASVEKVRQRQMSDLSGNGRPRKKSSVEKQVTGVRIEFQTEVLREEFVVLTRRIQQRMMPLPDV